MELIYQNTLSREFKRAEKAIFRTLLSKRRRRGGSSQLLPCNNIGKQNLALGSSNT